jgi:hypothetical protein
MQGSRTRKKTNQALMSQRSIILTGLGGLVGAVILTVLCLLVMVMDWIPVFVTDPSLTWIIFLFLAVFSLAEIPVMIFGIRRIAASVNPKARYVALLANAGYPFFGAVYAAPFILLTGQLGLGTAMAALSFVRFITAVIFIPR